MFCVHPKTKTQSPVFSNSSGLKSVFGVMLRFRDGLMWKVRLTVEIKFRPQFSPT